MQSNKSISPKPGVMRIAQYVGGASTVPGVSKIHKLSSNENPWGASLSAMAAYEAASSDLAFYPNPDWFELTVALGEVHTLDPARIVCGAGSDEMIALLCLGYAGVGDEVLYTEHGFLMYAIYANANGATPVKTAEVDLTASVDNILAACNERTKLVFIANPNNPTGTVVSSAEIERLAEGIPEHTLLVVDEAYGECIDALGHESGLKLVDRRQNVVTTRTFSKIHGLAGLRVGWMYAPQHVVETVNRIRSPFNVNSGAQAAAVAAIRDRSHVMESAAKTAAAVKRMTAELGALGVPCTESHANFVLAEFGTDVKKGAAAADDFLKSKGVIVRRMEGYGLPGHLRISVGDDEAMDALIAAVSEFRASA
ncbi:MAG: histidinol-phosphate transaminase [Pikeienuella sp.]